LKVRDLIRFGVVVGLFAAGMAARRWPIPRALTWLGLVSYSVYLLHLPIFETLRAQFGRPDSASTARWWVQLAMGAVIVAAILVASGISYRLVELPMQRLGHRLARWADNRYGADHAPTRATAATAEPQLTESVL
jgi:peptidoglycan/LPS O-acetylase OafA/YrhL